MEKFPQSNEQNRLSDSRPRLEIDFDGESGNVFWVVSLAKQALIEGCWDKLEGIESLEKGNAMVNDTATSILSLEHRWTEARKPGAGKNYEDILAMVNEYVELVDTSVSGRYPQYKPMDGSRTVDGTITPE